MLIEAYPGSERIANTNGMLPLHMACSDNEVATVQYLLGLYPESMNVATRDGAYPIHYAMKSFKMRANPASAVEIVKFLLDSDPKVSNVANGVGHYPIHYAIVCATHETNPGAAVEMVQLILDCDPDVALQKWGGRKFPLFTSFCMACNHRNNASIFNAAVKILHLLYDAHPEVIEDDEITKTMGRRDILLPREIQTFINAQLSYARLARNSTARQMKKRDENGQVPLHRALRDNAPLGSIKLLLKRNPSAVLIPDNSGALSLHLAILNHDSPKVVDYLAGLDPNTLIAVDREGNTALHVACRVAKHDIIALLLEKHNAVSVSQSNALNKLPVHLLLESDAVSNREDDTKYLESVFQLLRAYPETVMVSEDAKQQSTRYGGRPSRNGKKRKYHA